ncbi:A24 family peptidase [Bythopirellula polymerisocia]|uniref:Type 4 prepilin-like proteins leader peptide-processing enzyme n=1 Tax=Bythopirellula polymerisocia TaxID=2528003 RepID=A0A5C6CAM0_9BACT|nr:prepilin peptidase [Bythopirellula polymerisocia]TWU21268.1 Type 4 prepilin-like proteins leader peptide-processing enzyme [Bythopirellula polymerisocia]
MNSEFLIDFITALWLGFIGACIGSFLNVVAYRLPRGMSVIWKPSHCPKCNHPIRARDNVPVLGWLWLRGKCRDCGAAISPRYAIVEAAMGLAFFVVAYFELLRGSPFTELSGAIDVVWNPQWSAIGGYAYHCLLLSVFMTLLLMRLDKTISVPRFIVGSVLLLIVWPLAFFLFRIN